MDLKVTVRELLDTLEVRGHKMDHMHHKHQTEQQHTPPVEVNQAQLYLTIIRVGINLFV